MDGVKFGSLWVGGPLTKIQEVSLSSFVFYGHDITLYVYDLSIKVPYGVKVADARDILPEEDLFLVENSYAGFSDVFRYHMIKKTGLIWVDADTICLSKDWNFKDNIFASLEIEDRSCVVGGVLSLKQDSEILDYLIESVKYIDKEKMVWSELGPDLLDKAFKKFNYMEYAYDWQILLAIRADEWEILWDPKLLHKALNLYNTSKSISVYNQMCTRSGIDKNVLPEGSAMEYFYNKFVVKKDNTISLIVCSWNGYWDKFGLEVSKSINKFNTQPDEIIFVSDEEIEVQGLICTNIKKILLPKDLIGKKLPTYRNAGIEQSSSEWIVFLDLDDEQMPCYLDNLDGSSDIHAFSFLEKDSNISFYPDNTSLYKRLINVMDETLIPGTSAIKRSVFDKIKYESNCYEDLILYSFSHLLNLKVSYDQNIRFIYAGFHKETEHEEILRASKIYQSMAQGDRYLYCYWDTKYEMSQNRIDCLESMKKNSGVSVVLMDDEIFYMYENKEIPIHPGFKYLSPPSKSDYFRAYMMYFYGNGYSDIKRCHFDWNQYFDKLLYSRNDCLGYAEIDVVSIGNFWHEDIEMYKDVESKYSQFIGMGHFIYKPKTQLAFDWLSQVHKVMNENFDELEKNPSSHPYNLKGGCNESYSGDIDPSLANPNYPLRWGQVGGVISHEVQYRSLFDGIASGMPYVDISNYR